MTITKIPKFWNFLNGTNKRINILYGGAGSGKSYHTGLFLLFQKFIRESNKSILVVRKTMPSLRISAYKLILVLIDKYGLSKYVSHHKTYNTLRFKDNEINFIGLDDPEKIKSAEWNYIWAEEATDLTLDDFRQLNLRLRKQTDSINQIFLTLNPIDAFHWVKTEIIDKPDDSMAFLQSTYRDNPFLSQEYIKELDRLKEQDFTLWQIYSEGLWGILQNLIYSNYDVVDEFPSCDDIIYGIDFGFNNPSVVLKIGIKDKEIFVKELLYESGLTNSMLISRLETFNIGNNAIYADSAEPARIREIQNANYEIYESDKSVKDGIDWCKRSKLHITRESSNIIKEIRSYKYKEDRQGRVIDEPAKFNDHGMDAMRYALYTHFGKLQGDIIYVG